MSTPFELMRNLAFFFATVMLLKYFIFLMVAPFYQVQEYIRRLKIKDTKPYWEPLVTIIIPAWNEEIGIKKSITSLINNTYKNIEIIAVNDGSTDNTEKVIKKIKDKRLRYIKKQKAGKGSALNEGIKYARGEIIVTMDADSAFDKNAINNIVNYFKDGNVDALVGNVKIANGAGVLGLIQKLEYMFGFYFKKAHHIFGAEYIFGGACAAFRKKTTFEKFGLFDETNKTEDIEMSMRLRFNGIKSVYAEDVIAYTEGATTLLGLINQRLRWKKGRFDTFLKYRKLFFSFDRNHNLFLSWFILPFSLLSELQLLFEPFALTLLVAYSYISGDYLSLAIGSAFIFIIYLINGIFSNDIKNLKLIPMFFITWPLFYILVWVEYLALIKSFQLLLRGDNVRWQEWQRVGIQI